MKAAWPDFFACGVANHALTLSSTISPHAVKSLPAQCFPPNLSVALPKQSCIMLGIWKASYLPRSARLSAPPPLDTTVHRPCVHACAETYLALYAKSGVVT